MYWIDIYRFLKSNEYEYKYPGRYGAKGEKRKKREKATPEQIAKQNQMNREKRMRHLIKENFNENDLWITFKYPKGTRKLIREFKNDLRKFLRKARKEYKKLGEEFKYIYRIEIGSKGGIHIHMLANRIRDADLILQKEWMKITGGRTHYESLYEQGGYEKLAAYIVKKPEKESEEYKQLSLFDEDDQRELLRVSTSRNLIRPEPERKIYYRRTLRDLIENGPKPTPGYYIDKSSIRTGVNRYTGMSYYYYTEYRIRAEETEGSGQMEVKIYIQTDIRGPRARPGKGIYLLETMTSKGPATLDKTIKYESETENGAEIKTILAALKRLNQPCEVMIYTDTKYTASSYTQGWLGRWLAKDWKNAKGEEIAYREEWQQLYELFRTHRVKFSILQDHEYKNWMIRKMK